MRKLILLLPLLLISIVSFSQAHVKGTGIRYDRGIPTVAPGDTTYSTEKVIDLKNMSEYLWDRLIEDWVKQFNVRRGNGAPSGDPGDGPEWYVDNLSRDVYWWDDSMWFKMNDQSDSDNITPSSSYEIFDPALTFVSSKFYQTFTVTDSVIFTADTTGGIYGAHTQARINFGDTGFPVLFSGVEFDTVQTYNITSGDTLSGVHMFYFENTPYGVLISVPTNSISTTDTVGTVIPLDRSPADSIGSLIAEWDARYNVSIVDTVMTWTDLSNADRPARNKYASYLPTINGTSNGLVFDGTDDILSIDSLLRPVLEVNGTNDFTWTIAISFDGPSGDEYVFGMDNGGFVLVRGGNNNITYLGTGPFWNPTTGNHIIQMVQTDGTNEIFVDGVSIGSYTASLNTYKFGQMGDFTPIDISNSGKAFDGTVYFVAINQKAMTAPERTIMYNYINSKWSLGL